MIYDPNNKAEKPKARRPGGKTKRWPGKWFWIVSREDYRQMGKAMSAYAI